MRYAWLFRGQCERQMKYKGYAQKKVYMKFDACSFFSEFSDARTRVLSSH